MNKKGTGSQLPSDSTTSSSGAQITSTDSSTQRSRSDKGSYLAALMLVGGIIQVPVVASIITVLAYLTPSFKNALGAGNYNWSVIAIGIVGSLLIWLLLSSFCMRFTTSNGANASEYKNIKNHLLYIKSNANVWNEKNSATSTVSTNDHTADLYMLDEYIKAIEQELSNNDQSWVLGYGYISIWKKIHRAEEVMLSLMPTEVVIEQALHDKLRLEDSNISKSSTLLSWLQIAVSNLSPESNEYLRAGDQASNNLARVKAQSQESTSNSMITPQTRAKDVASLKEIRRNINDFNDKHWEAVIRARNQLIVTALITGTFTFVLLCIPIIQSVNISLIVSAVIFYLVGSITGFFSRLYAESKNPTALNDYGLSQARLFVIPVLSGFAGIAGIFIRAQLAPVAPTTASLFELSLQNIVVAATFGYSPNLFINALQSKTQAYLKDIESSNPQGGI
jgi:hypothetical protein